MNKIEIVQTAFSFDTPPEESQKYLSDDFQATDDVGSPPMDKEGWFGMGELMRHSFPDIGFDVTDIRQENGEVILTGRFTGTFTNDFDLSAMDMGVFKATGKRVDFPLSSNRISFDGDKICRSHNLDTGPNAGMGGIIRALNGN